MKQSLRIYMLTMILITLASCAGGKDISLEQEPPFSIKGAYFQDWVAGVQGGGSGTHVHITLSAIQEPIRIKEIYFRDKVIEAVQDKGDIDMYIGYFINENRRDVIMDTDPVKESVNIPDEKSPFLLEKNEAIISYMQQNEIKYYKVTNLIEKPMIAYPGVNNKGIN